MPVELIIILAFLLPLCIIPFLMRLFVSRLIFALIKRKYLPKFLKKLNEGWQEERDLQAINAVSQLAAERLKYHFLFNYKFKEDLETILLCVQNHYQPGTQKEEKLKFSFSVQKLVYCCLLGFADLYREYSEQQWFKIIKNVRLIWFWRLSMLSKHLQSFFYRIPLLDKLRQTRILGHLVRVLLIPILGTPLLIWYVIRSVSVTIFYEGSLRFFYGLLFMKVGYYIIYLYGRENTIISKRIARIPKKRISEISNEIENIMAQAFRTENSLHFDKALATYQALLKEFGIDEDEKLNTDVSKEEDISSRKLQQKIIKTIKIFLTNSKEAFKKQNPFIISQPQDKEQLARLYYELGKIYFPKIKEPGLMLRLREALELGYMSSLILLNFFFSTPGIDMLLGNISVDFILKVKELTKNDMLRNTLTNFNNSYKYVRVINKIFQIIKVARGIASPYHLVLTLSSPVVFQFVQKAFRQFVYHKSGRIMLYGWEANHLKRASRLTPLLWEL